MQSYNRSFKDFVKESPDDVIGYLGRLHAESGFATQYSKQVVAWLEEIKLVQETARTLLDRLPDAATWHILLEYEIPRRQRRPDIVILAHDIIFVIEYKYGSDSFLAESRWQVYDYALDLRDFHLESRDRIIVPVLCASAAEAEVQPYSRGIKSPRSVVLSNASNLVQVLMSVFVAEHVGSNARTDSERWINSAYRPTLTIIEAAEQLFNNHDVREISHSYADNLTQTTDAIVEYVQQAQREGGRYICFVTGVPGAGKTLTGLNAVHDARLRQNDRPSAIFLSGNGPLVSIVRSALIWNTVKRNSSAGRKNIERDVKTFIQNVHNFLKYYSAHTAEAPHEQVVVFDEAQRAWNTAQMERKWKVAKSEPELLLEVMERCSGWAVLVALVGGGQEIHRGEAGLQEWGKSLVERAKEWNVIASFDALLGGSTVAGQKLFDRDTPRHLNTITDQRMHLSVSVRSPRAQRITDWVNSLLSLDSESATRFLSEIGDFPLVVTRDLDAARRWLCGRSRRDLHHRCGLVASSGGIRLRAHGLEVSTSFTQGYSYDRWFLSPPEDIRSSYTLEVVATEFQCQGLELDWVGVCWADDLTISNSGKWNIRQFRGNRWLGVKDESMRQYIINKYRVLLTRAREGMIIWVPEGSHDDSTRSRQILDTTYSFLLESGLSELESTQFPQE